MPQRSPARRRIPKRRAPVSPSSTCEACRAYYKEETQLDMELVDVMRNFPEQIHRQEAQITKIKQTCDMWEEQPHPAISPDILKRHMVRKQEVLSLMHEGLEDEMVCAERWRGYHIRAQNHAKTVANRTRRGSNVPHGSPRLYSDNAAKQKEKLKRRRSLKLSQATEDSTPAFLTKLPDGTVIDEFREAGQFKRYWFHQTPQHEFGLNIKMDRVNMVDAAEACAKGIRAKQVERLQAEHNVLTAQLRDEVVRIRSESPTITNRNTRIVRQTAKESVAAKMLLYTEKEEEEEEDEGDDPTMPPTQPASRTLGDATFWNAATRAQAFPDKLSIAYPPTSKEAKQQWSPGPVAMSSPARLNRQQPFLSHKESIVREPASPAVTSPVSFKSPQTTTVRNTTLPPHPLAAAAHRLQNAQMRAMNHDIVPAS
eukprot:TRINITY_DN3199_c3_g1_i1.p1 TRINITY_DN3199_c3_g1~~TRINITY_DN3199_c3_g1_i1.p1  ORF type:complete len:442 (+),score=80.19 TRINITY_DN3199_c3_g1_i1:50-1327(+)